MATGIRSNGPYERSAISSAAHLAALKKQKPLRKTTHQKGPQTDHQADHQAGHQADLQADPQADHQADHQADLQADPQAGHQADCRQPLQPILQSPLLRKKRLILTTTKAMC